MKKLFLILIIALLFVGLGAGYTVFFMPKEQSVSVEIVEPVDATSLPVLKTLEPVVEEADYYVKERKLTVYSQPFPNALLIDTLYKGEKITVFEKQGDSFARISEYMVHGEGEEPVAEWVKLNGLSLDPPKIDESERLEILDGYLHQSDDLKHYQDVFRESIQWLLDHDRCEPDDFAELFGWVKSITFDQDPIYFIYCGGLSRRHKIYLNADNGEIFEWIPEQDEKRVIHPK